MVGDLPHRLLCVGGGQKLDHSGGQFSSTFWVANQTITEKRPRYLRSSSPDKTSQLWPPYWNNRSPPPTPSLAFFRFPPRRGGSGRPGPTRDRIRRCSSRVRSKRRKSERLVSESAETFGLKPELTSQVIAGPWQFPRPWPRQRPRCRRHLQFPRTRESTARSVHRQEAQSARLAQDELSVRVPEGGPCLGGPAELYTHRCRESPPHGKSSGGLVLLWRLRLFSLGGPDGQQASRMWANGISWRRIPGVIPLPLR